MSAHTPGPWFVTTQDDYPTGEVSADPMGVRHIVTTYCDDAKANARLIAAAPELLAALGRLLESGDVLDAADAGALKQARAAIARATGATA